MEARGLSGQDQLGLHSEEETEENGEADKGEMEERELREERRVC